jgi:protein phosphatase
MGGHAAGEVASGLIVSELNSVGIPGSLDDLEARFIERVGRAHDAILMHSSQLGGAVVGSTLAALLTYEGQFACYWAGDSRVYCLSGGSLIPVTEDHTEVRALLDSGAITAEEAATWSRRHVITRAIGTGRGPDCEVRYGTMRAGLSFLLCSDGLTGHMHEDEIAALMSWPHPAQAVAEALVAETLARGARDNVTVIVLRCHPPASVTAS